MPAGGRRGDARGAPDASGALGASRPSLDEDDQARTIDRLLEKISELEKERDLGLWERPYVEERIQYTSNAVASELKGHVQALGGFLWNTVAGGGDDGAEPEPSSEALHGARETAASAQEFAGYAARAESGSSAGTSRGLDEELAACLQERDALARKAERLQSECDLSESKAWAAEAQLQELRQASSALEQEQDAAAGARRDADAALASCEQQVLDAQASAEAEKARCEAELREQKAGLAAAKKELWGQLNEVKDELAHTSAEKEGILRIKEQLEGRIASMRAALLARESEVASLEAKGAEHAEEIAAMRREAAGRVEEVAALRREAEERAGKAAEAEAALASAQERFMRERDARRELHNVLQELRGNIRVVCRVRPVGPEEAPCVSFPLPGMLRLQPPGKEGIRKVAPREFEFDGVLCPQSTQEEVYEQVAPLVRSAADGYNVCVFAYGQTGSGKTFTMEGPREHPGVSLRAVEELFRLVGEGGGGEPGLAVSMLEVHLEAVRDLLGGGGAEAPSLEVHTGGRVPGLTLRAVRTPGEVLEALQEGAGRRSTAATGMNEHSSRSHSILSVHVTAPSPSGPGGKGVRAARRGSLHLVDLAGSERVARSGVSGQGLKEAQAINKSLSALGDVVSALKRRSAHVPFRNSKLTMLLQDSLGGDSKVMLLCNINPDSDSASESLSSLNFALRCAACELGPAKAAAAAALDQEQPPGEVPAESADGVRAGSGGGGGGKVARGVKASGGAPRKPLQTLDPQLQGQSS